MPLINHKRNADGTYGPATSGDFYISKPDHRKTAKKKKGKTRWAINEGQEFNVFYIADKRYSVWFCKVNNCLFSLVEGGKVILGKGGERLAKFPNDRNQNEPWHGYPVLSEELQNRPSSEVLKNLVDEDIIPTHVMLKIEKGFL